jgi:membrane fusion protein (multidrug efflux system)
MNRQTISGLAILFLLLASVIHIGCGAEDDANASKTDGENGKAEPAKVAKDGEAVDESEDGKDKDEDEDKDKEEDAVPVEVAEIYCGAIESVLRFSSNLEAENQVKVVSQAKRQVTELLVEEGDEVTAGQLLIRLQNDEQRSALTKVKSQLAKAEREYTQQQRLYEQQLISEQVYNDATYAMEQLQIAIEDAERELSYTEVRAPIAGTITERLINLGDQVQIGQDLFDIVDFDSIVARVFVPEKHLVELSRGLPARISSQARSATDYTGKVKRVSPIVDPKSGTVKVTIEVGRQAGLRPGMYVDVDLVTATNPDAVLVPKRALVYDNDQVFVYKLGEENRVKRVFIEPRLTDKHHVEPVEGIESGDQIVVAGQAGLKDGALVSLPGDEASAEPEESDETDAETVARAEL